MVYINLIITIITLLVEIIPASGKYQVRNTGIDNSQSSQFLGELSEILYGLWEHPSKPIDLEQIDNFGKLQCLIIITNYIGLDLLQLRQPTIIRKLIPAIFQENQSRPVLSWISENKGRPSEVDPSCFEKASNEPNDDDFSHCGRYDLWKLARTSKPWKCEVLVDIFPPLIQESKQPESYHNYLFAYMYNINSFTHPTVWTFGRDLVSVVPPGKVPIINIFMVSSLAWNDTFKNSKIGKSMMSWMNVNFYSRISPAVNVVTLLVGISKHKQQVSYSIEFIYCVHPEDWWSKYSIISTPVAYELNLEKIYALFEQAWNRQMHWEIIGSIGVQIFKSNLDKCGQQIYNQLKSHSDVTAKDLQNHGIIDVLKSMFYNYTYDNVCENGEIVGTTHHYLSKVKIEFSTLEPLLHQPLQVRSPIHSHRFVVCGIRGSDSMAFSQLISIYDEYVWSFLIASIVSLAGFWAYLKQDLSSPFSTAGGNLYSLMKVVLEQGDFALESVTKEKKKIQVLLGLFLLMGIILSNGYKNSNVYNMIAPLKPVRYEKFQELVDDQISIFTSSSVHLGNWISSKPSWEWLPSNISVRRVSDRQLSYYIGEPNQEILKAMSFLPEINPTRFLANDKDKDLNNFVRNSCHIYNENVLEKWLESYKLLNPTSEGFSYSEMYFKLSTGVQYPKIERMLLYKSLLECNSTALVVLSEEAEAYARILTSARGNVGKEVYFQQYLVFQIQGMVTPPLIKRLAKIK